MASMKEARLKEAAPLPRRGGAAPGLLDSLQHFKGNLLRDPLFWLFRVDVDRAPLKGI